MGCQVSKGEGSGQRPGHSPRPSPLVPSSCPCILSGKCTRVPSFQSPTRAQGARAFWQGSQVRSLLSGHGGWARGCPSRENLCAAPVARHLRPGAAPGRALCQAGPGWRDAAPRAPRGQDLESQADQVLCRRGRNSAVHSAQRGARRHIRAKARLSRTYSAAREALRGLRLRRTNPAPPRNSPSLELRWVQASRAGPRVPCCTLSPPGTPAAAGLPSSQRSRLQAATWPGRAPPSPAPGAIR